MPKVLVREATRAPSSSPPLATKSSPERRRLRTSGPKETGRLATKGAVRWRCLDENGAKLGHFDGETGAELFSWPVAELTMGTVRERWGAGSRTLEFFDARGAFRGRKLVRLRELPPELSPTRPAPAAIVPVDPWARAMELLGTLNSIADTKAQRAIESQQTFLQQTQANAVSMFREAMGHRSEPQAQTSTHEALTLILSELKSLRERVDGLEEDDDDDVDDGDEPPRAPGPAGIQYPEQWTDIGDFVYRLVARNMPMLESRLPELIAMVQRKVAASSAARTPAAPPPPPVQTFAPPPPPPPPPPPSEAPDPMPPETSP